MKKMILALSILSSASAMANFVAISPSTISTPSNPSKSVNIVAPDRCDDVLNHITRAELDTLVSTWEGDQTLDNETAVSEACTGSITDFSSLFYESDWDSDLSSWDVSNGIDFSNMFALNLDFKQDISSWDVSKGVNFNEMFRYTSSFNQDISGWDTSSAVSWYAFDIGSGFDVWNMPAKFR